MCGIAGWLGAQADGEDCITRLASSLKHRGPDGQGDRSWSGCTLVQTRLSIIDLSAAGSQPMANEDQNVWVAFNGEIYNHRELRAELRNRGHIFRGHSDTEVIPHLYEEYHADFVQKLRGMFALAVYDVKNKTLVLARDRFGIKPLFYAGQESRLAFASEIGALCQLPGIDLRPDKQAVNDFASLCYIPAPETFYVGIRSLEPGQTLVACRGQDGVVRWKVQTYHRWAIAPDPGLTFDRAVRRADELIGTAVARQLESDVPLGALLSGGIDSSLVSSAAQEAVGGDLRTFNVRFSDRSYDESWAALAVAKHINSNHRMLEMDEVRGTWDHVTQLLLHSGQPFADTSVFAVNAVSRMMRAHVKVALSGDGGDEGFGGYDSYSWIEKICRLQMLPRAVWGIGSVLLRPAAYLGLVPGRLPRRLDDLSGADDIGVVEDIYCWVRPQEHRRLIADTDVLPLRRLFEPQWEVYLPKNSTRLECLSALATEANIRLTLPNDFLFKVDMASMKESLEVRVPMLDEDLIAFGLTLPHTLKVQGRTCKRVLRAVAKQRLPRDVATKPKRGFAVPVDTWVTPDFKERLKEALLGRDSRLSEFFRPEAYRPVVEAFCDGRPCVDVSQGGLYQRVIMLLTVHLAMSQARMPSEAALSVH